MDHCWVQLLFVPLRWIPEQLQTAPFRTADAVQKGVTEEQLRGDRFRHVFHDVYVAACLPESLELSCDAARLLLPKAAVFCDVTAARLYGVPVPDRDQRLHIAVPSSFSTIPRIKDLKVHSYTIPPDHVRMYGGRFLVSPERLFLELSAALPRIDRIIAGDHMLRRNLTTRELLQRFLHGCYRRRGVRRARTVLPLLVERADSPPETRLRILIIDAGLPCPEVNRDIYNDDGDWLARPDLSYPSLKIAIEYEGRHHQEEYGQYSRDIERDGRMIDHGWVVIRVNKDSLFGNPSGVVNRVRRARSRRLHPR